MPREGKGQDARFRLATGSVAEAFQVLPNNYTIKKKKLTFSPCPPPLGLEHSGLSVVTMPTGRAKACFQEGLRHPLPER